MRGSVMKCVEGFDVDFSIEKDSLSGHISPSGKWKRTVGVSLVLRSTYIRLAFNTPAESIVALLIQAYRLPVPDLIISINTGGMDAETYSHAGS
ncbi:unnamed protein product, partial [Didymodactylos carnosus]